MSSQRKIKKAKERRKKVKRQHNIIKQQRRKFRKEMNKGKINFNSFKYNRKEKVFCEKCLHSKFNHTAGEGYYCGITDKESYEAGVLKGWGRFEANPDGNCIYYIKRSIANALKYRLRKKKSRDKRNV